MVIALNLCAAHKHTAAEIIFERANAESENMGNR